MDARDRIGQRANVERWDQGATPAGIHYVGQSARPVRNHWRARELRFHGHEAESLVYRRHHHRLCAMVQRRKRAAPKLTEPVDAVGNPERLRVGAQCTALFAVTNNIQ
jgi:hypothetical protein